MFNWFRRKPEAAPAPRLASPGSFFSTHVYDHGGPLVKPADVIDALVKMAPRATDAADDAGTGPLKMTSGYGSNIPDSLAMWYASQGFIGYQMCALLAQHWLIAKACGQPGKDAIRTWFDVVGIDGDALDPRITLALASIDRRMKLRVNLEEFVRLGRIFGIRIALFQVESEDADYYAKPFNIDGVQPGTYKGIVQVDPYWCAPQLNQQAAANPASRNFYEPTYWQIQGKKYHRSHLVIFRNDAPPDILKPAYLYGGIPVPQRIMERVYAAERTANEAPQLAMTKRTTVWKTDMAAFAAKGDEALQKLLEWTQYRDNYGVKLGDKEGDDIQQFDTALGDLDATIMTQYQLVAAAAHVPATKLLGTSPKGFGASGEYEEANYREELESLQAHALTDLVERHHALAMRSHVAPRLALDPVETMIQWRPLDSPTAKEVADTNLAKAQTGAALVSSGAIDSEEERRRIAKDPASGYGWLGERRPDQTDPDADDETAG